MGYAVAMIGHNKNAFSSWSTPTMSAMNWEVARPCGTQRMQKCKRYFIPSLTLFPIRPSTHSHVVTEFCTQRQWHNPIKFFLFYITNKLFLVTAGDFVAANFIRCWEYHSNHHHLSPTLFSLFIMRHKAGLLVSSLVLWACPYSGCQGRTLLSAYP